MLTPFGMMAFHVSELGLQASRGLHSRKLTWKPKKSHVKTTVLLKGDYMGFHVSLGGCRGLDADEHGEVQGKEISKEFRVV